jgi:hypothetical protein
MDRRLIRRRLGPVALGLVIGGLGLCSRDIARDADGRTIGTPPPPPIVSVAPTARD